MPCIHSSVDGHLGCFHFGAILNNASMTTRLHVFVRTYIYYQGNIRENTRSLLQEGLSAAMIPWEAVLVLLPSPRGRGRGVVRQSSRTSTEMSRVGQGPCCVFSLPHSNASLPAPSCNDSWWALLLVAEKGADFGWEARSCLLPPSASYPLSLS